MDFPCQKRCWPWIIMHKKFKMQLHKKTLAPLWALCKLGNSGARLRKFSRLCFVVDDDPSKKDLFNLNHRICCCSVSFASCDSWWEPSWQNSRATSDTQMWPVSYSIALRNIFNDFECIKLCFEKGNWKRINDIFHFDFKMLSIEENIRKLLEQTYCRKQRRFALLLI